MDTLGVAIRFALYLDLAAAFGVSFFALCAAGVREALPLRAILIATGITGTGLSVFGLVVIAAAMAGVVCYLVIGNAAQVFLAVPPAAIPPGTGEAIAATLSAAWKAATIAKLQVPIGIVAGLVGGACYNRFSTARLPDYLAFFGGRRLVPIVAGIVVSAVGDELLLAHPDGHAGGKAVLSMIGGPLLFLIGTEIDYVVPKLASKFVFRNPNETDACGCGESVTIIPAAALDAD